MAGCPFDAESVVDLGSGNSGGGLLQKPSRSISAGVSGHGCGLGTLVLGETIETHRVSDVIRGVGFNVWVLHARLWTRHGRSRHATLAAEQSNASRHTLPSPPVLTTSASHLRPLLLHHRLVSSSHCVVAIVVHAIAVTSVPAASARHLCCIGMFASACWRRHCCIRMLASACSIVLLPR